MMYLSALNLGAKVIILLISRTVDWGKKGGLSHVTALGLSDWLGVWLASLQSEAWML